MAGHWQGVAARVRAPHRRAFRRFASRSTVSPILPRRVAFSCGTTILPSRALRMRLPAVSGLKLGMKLIVIDPRHVGLANKADIWLRIRPGADGALALGMANILIERGWYDQVHSLMEQWPAGGALRHEPSIASRGAGHRRRWNICRMEYATKKHRSLRSSHGSLQCAGSGSCLAR